MGPERSEAEHGSRRTNAAPRRRNKVETRRRIIASSQALFTSNGFVNTTVDEISDMSGVSRQTFYSHFSDKTEVLATIVEDYLPAASEIFGKLPGPVPSFQQVHGWLGEWTRFAVREQATLLTLTDVAAGVPGRLAAIHSIMERLFGELAARLPAFAATQRDDALGLRARARAEMLMYAITWTARVGAQSDEATFRDALIWDAAELIHDFTRSPSFVAAGIQWMEELKPAS